MGSDIWEEWVGSDKKRLNLLDPFSSGDERLEPLSGGVGLAPLCDHRHRLQHLDRPAQHERAAGRGRVSSGGAQRVDALVLEAWVGFEEFDHLADDIGHRLALWGKHKRGACARAHTHTRDVSTSRQLPEALVEKRKIKQLEFTLVPRYLGKLLNLHNYQQEAKKNRYSDHLSWEVPIDVSTSI